VLQAINDMYPAYACSVDTVANMKAELVQKQEAQMAGGAAHTRSSPAAASSGVAASAADTRRAFDAAIMTRHLTSSATAMAGELPSPPRQDPSSLSTPHDPTSLSTLQTPLPSPPHGTPLAGHIDVMAGVKNAAQQLQAGSLEWKILMAYADREMAINLQPDGTAQPPWLSTLIYLAFRLATAINAVHARGGGDLELHDCTKLCAAFHQTSF
jgi:hypothetical protein